MLLEREVIFSEDLEEIFGKRPWGTKYVIHENGNGEDKPKDEIKPEEIAHKEEEKESQTEDKKESE